MSSMASVFDDGVETATAESLQSYDIVNAAAEEAVENSTLANAPGDDSVMDSAAVEKAMMVAKPAEVGTQAAQEATPEQVAQEAAQKEEQQYGRGANKRIRDLVAERNETRQAMAAQQAQFTQQMQQMQMQVQQQQAEYQRHQMELENRRLSMLESERAAREEAGLSEVEKARRKFLSDAQKEALQGIAPEIEALKQQLGQERQWRDELTRRAEQRSRFAKIDAMGKEVLEKDLLNGYDPADAAKLKEPMEEMLHAFAGAYKEYPNQVAPRFKQFLQQWYAAESKRISKTAGARLAQGQLVPTPLPAAKTTGGAAQGNWPSIGDLKRADYDNHVAWMRAGSPQIKANK